MGKDDKQKTKLPELATNIGYLLRIMWEHDKFMVVMLVMESLCNVALPFFGIYLPKVVISLLTGSADTYTIAVQLGGFTLGMAAVYFIGRYASGARYWRINSLRPLLMIRLFLKTLDCNYGELESPEGQMRYRKAIQSLANGDGSATSRLVPSVFNFITGVVGFALYSTVLASLHPMIVLLLIATSLINYFVLRHVVNYEYSRKEENAILGKKLEYISSNTADFKSGKDIRLYDIKQLFFNLRDNLINQMITLNTQIQGKWLLSKVVNALITLARDGLAYAYLIWMVTGGRMAAADFVFYFGAIAGFSTWLTSILNQFNTINGAQLEMSDVRLYLEANPEPDSATQTPDLTKAPSITFEDVCFSYSEGGLILNHFSVAIKPGEKIALVGINGAGKTTLVKLLCGFYKPDSGRILINDEDTTQYKHESLCQLFSAVFQDIMILPHTLAENIALRPENQMDRERINEALDNAGLLDYFRSLAKGIDTPMMRYDQQDGLNLSGGQQQKLLLARALYKNAPVLVLDEPTAALDPIAESELYEQYHSLAQDKTALYISHRLASTRFCDRIIYLNNGIAEETGSHDQLMQMNGGYAHMFEVQSHYYKENVEEAAI